MQWITTTVVVASVAIVLIIVLDLQVLVELNRQGAVVLVYMYQYYYQYQYVNTGNYESNSVVLVVTVAAVILVVVVVVVVGVEVVGVVVLVRLKHIVTRNTRDLHTSYSGRTSLCRWAARAGLELLSLAHHDSSVVGGGQKGKSCPEVFHCCVDQHNKRMEVVHLDSSMQLSEGPPNRQKATVHKKTESLH